MACGRAGLDPGRGHAWLMLSRAADCRLPDCPTAEGITGYLTADFVGRRLPQQRVVDAVNPPVDGDPAIAAGAGQAAQDYAPLREWSPSRPARSWRS
jgi:hypothetical protein